MTGSEEAAHILVHDLKEPARCIRYFLELIRDECDLDEEHDGYLDSAIRGVNAIERTVAFALTKMTESATPGGET